MGQQLPLTLGCEVRCRITGYQGIATARVEYLNGTVEYAVTPQTVKDGYPKPTYINGHSLERIGDGLSAQPVQKRVGFHFPDPES